MGSRGSYPVLFVLFEEQHLEFQNLHLWCCLFYRPLGGVIAYQVGLMANGHLATRQREPRGHYFVCFCRDADLKMLRFVDTKENRWWVWQQLLYLCVTAKGTVGGHHWIETSCWIHAAERLPEYVWCCTFNQINRPLHQHRGSFIIKRSNLQHFGSDFSQKRLCRVPAAVSNYAAAGKTRLIQKQ